MMKNGLNKFMKGIFAIFSIIIISCINDDSKEQTYVYKSEKLNLTEKENYILENQSKIDGKIKYFINNDVFFEVEIYAGKKIRPPLYHYASIFSAFIQEDKYPDKDICSYDGIQDCVQFAIY